MLFQKLNIPYSFLQRPVPQKKENKNFKILEDFCKLLAVIIDHVEESVALVQSFSGHLTKEEQLQVVFQHYKEHTTVIEHDEL